MGFQYVLSSFFFTSGSLISSRIIRRNACAQLLIGLPVQSPDFKRKSVSDGRLGWVIALSTPENVLGVRRRFQPYRQLKGFVY
jgi:hypothetical protein